MSKFRPSNLNELKNAIREYIQLYKNNPTKYEPIDTSIFTKGSIKNWDISNVDDFDMLFSGLFIDNSTLFMQKDITQWDVGHVKYMNRMFENCISFNQFLNTWYVINVQDMQHMFAGCSSFNQPLDRWKVENVEDMQHMFAGCSSFNRPLNSWNVAKVEKMNNMFERCSSFNQPLDRWNVTNVENMNNMFERCSSFNQLLNSWNVANVGDMNSMFLNCASFNQPLNRWNVANVGDMNSMFAGCSSFNQPLDRWNVANVEDMSHMFMRCTSFNQRLTSWNVQLAIDMLGVNGMFHGCPIDEVNKPILSTTPRNRPIVNPTQIHEESKKINYDKFFAFMGDKLSKPLKPINANYINSRLFAIVDSCDTSPEKKQEQKEGITQIMNQRLNRISYDEFSSDIKKAVFQSVEYTLLQPEIFKETYIQTYIKDCVHAYEGVQGMTCSAGGLERLITELIPACVIMLTMPIAADKKEEYETLLNILSPPLDDYIKDWYQTHKQGTPGAFPTGTSVEEKKADLKRYLLTKFPGEEELIDKKIEEFQHAIGYEDEDFTYGGKKKTRRRTKRTKRSTNKKRKNGSRSRTYKSKSKTKKYTNKKENNKKV